MSPRHPGGFFRRVFQGSRSGTSYAITVLTPVRSGAEAELASYLSAVDTVNSPLAQLPTVHFGRWVIIDQLKTGWCGAPVPAPKLKSQYLLFTACVTAPGATTFLSQLTASIPDSVDAIWGYCLGYPAGGAGDEAAVVKYLSRGLIKTSLFYGGHSDVTPAEVDAALTGHARFVDFVLSHQGREESAALKEAYLQEAPTWFP